MVQCHEKLVLKNLTIHIYSYDWIHYDTDCTIIDTSEERKGCRQLPEIPNGNVIYILTDPQEEPVVDGCYERDTFARNKCDEGFRVTGPSSRACSGVFVDNELISVSWVPDDPVTCVRKFMVPAWDN